MAARSLKSIDGVTCHYFNAVSSPVIVELRQVNAVVLWHRRENKGQGVVAHHKAPIFSSSSTNERRWSIVSSSNAGHGKVCEHGLHYEVCSLSLAVIG